MALTYEERLKHQKNVEIARMILRDLRGWEQDKEEPPSLKYGYQRPSNDDIAWARAVLELERQEVSDG